MSGEHWLIVGPFDPDDDTDMLRIEHSGECSINRCGGFYEDVEEWSCHVGFYEEQDGVTGWFCHADDPELFVNGRTVVPVGRHLIEAWSEKVEFYWATEYNGGLRLAGAAVTT